MVIGLTFLTPYLPSAGVLGFMTLRGILVLMLVGITALYIGTAELDKARLERIVA